MSAVEAEEVSTETPVAQVPKAEGAKGAKQERERSTIEFSYLGLDAAMEIAKAVHARGGTRAGTDEVAAQMGESATSGPFRAKITNSRVFGLTTYASGVITLTPIGSRLADPDQEKAAKAEAFLQVPLYRRLYEEYKGSVLPPTNAALENVIVAMGVAPKQKDKARQAFQRSAALAGFFAYGTTKLVYPAVDGGESKPLVKPRINGDEEVPNEKGGAGSGNGGGGGGGQLHPFVQGLLEELPQPHTDWPLEGRKKWLQSALSIFDLIYESSDGDRPLVVGFEKTSAK